VHDAEKESLANESSPPTCLPACLPAYLPACLPACLLLARLALRQ